MTFKLPEKIEVKDRHILEGCQSDSSNCPISLAFLDALDWDNLTERVSTNCTDIVFHPDSEKPFRTKTISRINLNLELAGWIAAYDFSENPMGFNPITVILKKDSKGNPYYALGDSQ